MAASNIPKTLSVRNVTISGTADTNGFIDSNLKTADCVILGAKSLQTDGVNRTGFFLEVANNGGPSSNTYGFRFRAWNGNLYTGQISAVLVIGE